MKKAQTEMLGLVVIVILIIFALVIYILFSAQSKPETNTKQSIIVYNTLNAILKLNPSCNQETLLKPMHRIISDCTKSTQSPCASSNSCWDYVKKQLKNALEATLGQKRQYQLVISGLEVEDIIIETQDFKKCQKIIVDNSQKGSFMAKLSICS